MVKLLFICGEACEITSETDVIRSGDSKRYCVLPVHVHVSCRRHVTGVLSNSLGEGDRSVRCTLRFVTHPKPPLFCESKLAQNTPALQAPPNPPTHHPPDISRR